jgi:hypothetical protein
MMVQAGANDALINKELETEIRTLAEKTKRQSTIKKSTPSWMPAPT